MNKRELMNLLQEHPYLIDPTFIRSRSEAIRIVEQSNCTIDEFIERAKKHSMLPPEAWAEFDAALARRHECGKSQEEPKEDSAVPACSVIGVKIK